MQGSYPRAMNTSWADGGYENAGPGPSRGARVALTVLILVVSALSAVVYARSGLEQSRAECYRDAPAGTVASDVTTTFRWFPPGYDCSYGS